MAALTTLKTYSCNLELLPIILAFNLSLDRFRVNHMDAK